MGSLDEMQRGGRKKQEDELNAQLRQLSLLLEEKTSALDASEAELQRRREVHLTMEQQIGSLEMRVAQKQKDGTALQGKISDLEAKLGEKEEEIAVLTKENKAKHEQNDVLKHAVKEMENRKAEWKKREEGFARELQEMGSLLEDKSAALHSAESEVRNSKERCLSMNGRIEALQASLREKVEELKSCKDACMTFQSGLNNSQDDLGSLRSEMEQQTSELKDKLAASQRQLKQITVQLESKARETEILASTLMCKDADLVASKEEIQQFRGRNSALEFSVETLQGRVSKLLEELHHNDEKMQHMGTVLANADSRVASSDQIIKELEVKIEVGNEVTLKLAEAEGKIRELETVLAETVSLVQEKDEKLSASEWAVQQLGNEISKVKANLTQAERDHVRLQYKFSDLERQLKIREDELSDMESYGERLQKQLALEEAECTKVKESMIELEKMATEWKKQEGSFQTRLKELGCLLDEKVAALAASELDIQKWKDLQQTTEAAVNALQIRLGDVEKTADGRQNSIDQLCEKIEVLSSDKQALDAQLRDACDKLQYMEGKSREKVADWKDKEERYRSELKELSSFIELKTAALDLAESEIKRQNELREVMEGAIDSLKLQVTGLEDVSSTRQGTVDALCEELQKSKAREDCLNAKLNDLESKLQQMEQWTGSREAEWRLKEECLAEEVKDLKLVVEKQVATLAASELEVKNARVSQESMKGAIESLENDLVDARSRLSSAQLELVKLLHELDESKLREETLIGQLKELDDKSKNLELMSAEKTAEWKERENCLTTELSELRLSVEEKMATLTALDSELQSWRKTQMNMEDVISSLKLRLADAESTASSRQADLERLSGELEGSMSREDSLHTQLTDLKSKLGHLEQISLDRAAEWKEKEEAMATQLKELRCLLEDKTSALASSEFELKHLKEMHQAKDGGLEALKLQLAHFESTSSARQEDFERLCKDLEESKSREDFMRIQLRDLNNKLENMEQISLDRAVEWKGKEEDLTTQLKELRFLLEEKKSVLDASEIETTRLKEMHQAQEEAIEALKLKLGEAECQSSSNHANVQELSAALELSKSREDSMRIQLRDLNNKLENMEQISLDRAVEWKGKDEDLTSQLTELRFLLEEKKSVLDASEIETKRLKKMHQAQDGAIEALKLKLGEAECQSSSNHANVQELSAALELSKSRECSLDLQLKNLTSKLQRLDEISNANAAEWNTREETLLSEIQELTAVVTEKAAVITRLNSEVQRGKELQHAAEGALASLKGQLVEAERTSAYSRARMESICEKLEVSKAREDGANAQLGSLKGKIQLLEQTSADGTSTFQLQTGELRKELNTALLGLKDLEGERRKIVEELSRREQKCQSLSELVATKTRMLSEMEFRLSSLEKDLLDQKQAVEERDGALRIARAQQDKHAIFNLQLEKEVARLSRELGGSNEKISIMGGEIASLQKVIASKDREFDMAAKNTISDLKVQLERAHRDLEMERQSTNSVETLLADWQFKVQLALKEKEAFKAEHDMALRTINDLQCQVKVQKERQEKLESFVKDLQSKAAASEQKLSMRENKFKQVLFELENTQLNSKDLVQQMLTLHETLIQDDAKAEKCAEAANDMLDSDHRTLECGAEKAVSHEEYAHYLELCDSLIRKNVGLERQVEMLHRKNRVILKQIEGFQSSNKSKIADTKENLPDEIATTNSGTSWKQPSPDGDKQKLYGDCEQQRAPLQTLQPQFAKRRRQSDVEMAKSDNACG